MIFDDDDLFKPELGIVDENNKELTIKKYTPLILVLGGLLLIMFN